MVDWQQCTRAREWHHGTGAERVQTTCSSKKELSQGRGRNGAPACPAAASVPLRQWDWERDYVTALFLFYLCCNSAEKNWSGDAGVMHLKRTVIDVMHISFVSLQKWDGSKF